ncbi:helix-turn-helix domain-containing protein [Desulfitobacterium chlororespirans]|uniref:AraC-type DNA-binding protein n=1 Tax=Desulfitobacterium chlororespirans DSM 11544 TaxID=1121395 RepID=A0A1M7SK93_9FIRM|nr:AraC family transcriptional regulator [Desulfitobacterium chlororespirans]SHN58818.1 AraC-type DNA-binding protein [Desulfitobacterium chlororespirans DSM 11544]
MRLANSAPLMRELYGPDIRVVVQEKENIVYKMENAGGEGMITRYQVFPGIELLYNDFHMGECEQNKLPCRDMMEINHCWEGRFECEFPNGSCTYLGQGDLAVNMLTNRTTASFFPLAHYHGISVVIDLAGASETIDRLAAVLGNLPIDLYAIRDKLCGKGACCVMRAQESVQHIFSELYTAPDELRQGYFKLKVLELLLFLTRAESPRQGEERRYFYKNQVAVIKAMKEYMTEHLDRHFTLKELSVGFNIPLTSMKECFKGVYGTSIYAYMQSCRMEAAALMLRQTGDSVTVIAEKVGYANSSKFSEAFKKQMMMTPSEYRNKRV